MAFSLNPQNNAYDEAVINANFGLGETVVTGQVTPDTYAVDKVAQEILDRQVAAKAHAVWLRSDGGTEQRPNNHPDAPALTDAQALQVAALAESVESHVGHPVDIEWAFYNGTLYPLQSRPITTWLPLFFEMCTAPGDPKRLYLDLIVLTQGMDAVKGGRSTRSMITTDSDRRLAFWRILVIAFNSICKMSVFSALLCFRRGPNLLLPLRAIGPEEQNRSTRLGLLMVLQREIIDSQVVADVECGMLTWNL